MLVNGTQRIFIPAPAGLYCRILFNHALQIEFEKKVDDEFAGKGAVVGIKNHFCFNPFHISPWAG